MLSLTNKMVDLQFELKEKMHKPHVALASCLDL